jgi:hypothetical protein
MISRCSPVWPQMTDGGFPTSTLVQATILWRERRRFGRERGGQKSRQFMGRERAKDQIFADQLSGIMNSPLIDLIGNPESCEGCIAMLEDLRSRSGALGSTAMRIFCSSKKYTAIMTRPKWTEMSCPFRVITPKGTVLESRVRVADGVVRIAAPAKRCAGRIPSPRAFQFRPYL